MKITVLGAGRVGNAIARDLAHGAEFDLTIADVSQGALDLLADLSKAKRIRADLSDPGSVARSVADADLVVGAVPGSMGFNTLKTVLESGKNIVDISFFEEDPFRLDELAKERGLTAIVDCGIAPGCSNLILGYLDTVLEKTESFLCLVGGLPVQRTWPYEYKAVFSPSDVLEEYIRPARYVAGGKLVTLPALTEPEFVEFAGIGTLEAFNTDGLRTLIRTIDAPFMKEKTMRYPGHVAKMRILRETGFFRKDPIDVGGVRVTPLEMTSKLLFPLWKLQDEEEDFTVMRIEVAGYKQGTRVQYIFDMLDRYDPTTKTTSMARTTGYTCTAAVRLFAKGLYRKPGIAPPELLGRESGCYLFVMQDLAKRGVVFRETVT